jgi:O-antigen/teichoic acid export membrane protein
VGGSAVRPSLRSGFAWTVTGNIANGFGQWAILAVLAKLGSAEMLGQYALAMAIALPVAMLAHLNLRAVLATDVNSSHPFADYATVRWRANVVAFGVLALISIFTEVPVLVLLIGAGILAENSSDLRYAVMQRRDRLDVVAQSMILRAVLAIVFVAGAVWLFRSSLAAAAAYCATRTVVLFAWDLPRGQTEYGIVSDPSAVLRAALPLGFTLMLTSLTTNVPRYAIEKFEGTRELGVWAAVASFVTVGSTVVNAAGQTALTRVARRFADGDSAAVRRIAWRMAGIAVALAAAGTLVAAVAGRQLLALLYRPEFGDYAGVLLWMLMAAALGWSASMLGFVSTAMREFRQQSVLLGVSALVSGAVSFAAVPAFGLWGAVGAVAAAGAVQLAGQIRILSRAL